MIRSELTACFSCKPELLFSILTDNGNYAWRSDIKNIDIVDPGVRFIEYTKDGFPTFFTITKKIRNKSYAFKIENNNIKGQWVGTLQAEGAMTTLTLTEHIEVIKRPILRLLIPFYLKRQQKRYVEDLQNYLLTLDSNN